MKTIKFNSHDELIVNKSKFITYLFKLDSLEEIETHLNELRKKYKDATHHCYSYNFENKKKCSDDGEPSGTAGIPITSVLEQKEVENVLCVVIRYFGGVKLGAGGLIRAYRKSVIDALDKNEIIEVKKGHLYSITFDYDDTKKVENLLKDKEIISKEFNDKVTYTFKAISLEENQFNIKIIKDIYL